MAATRSRRDLPIPSEDATRSRDWSTILLAGLIGARFFLPTESAAEGETLWLVVLTLVYAAAQHFLRWRNGEGPRRPDRVDAAMLALVAAHLVSAGAVVYGSGQKRAAINMAWEWLASLLLWFEFRKRFESGHGGTLIRTVLTLCVVLATYGIWQNQVWFKENATLAASWESLHSRSTPLTPEEASRLDAIDDSLGSDFRSATGGTKRMLLDRMRSTEPIGCFGLANSLSGLLAVGLWLTLANGLSLFRRPVNHDPQFAPGLLQRWGPRLIVAAVYAVLAVCLIMTKSRTALAGLLIAGGVYWFVRQTGKWFRQGTIAAVTVVLAAMAILSLALLTGLIDQEVISEAPLSMKYRLEYWAATARMIVEHIWLGCGPGNFRPNYLHHKLAGASEEILDPHNLLLDVWANAGVVAWAGLMALLIWGVRTGWRSVMSESESRPGDRQLPLLRWSEGVQSALAGPALVILQQVAFGAGADELMWVFLIACPFLGGWLTSLSSGMSRAPIWAAWIALSIHLCGAGGIAMPAIFQVWALLLACLVTAPQRLLAEPIETTEPKRLPYLALPISLGVAVCCLTLGIICIRTTLVPNALCRANLSDAMNTMATTVRAHQAERQLITATENDPLNPEPWVLLVQLRAKPESGEVSESALDAGTEAILRNPENPLSYELLGDKYAAVDPASSESRAAAVQWYREAAERYPNSARIRSSLAISHDRAGHKQEAAKDAARALKLDDLNQAAGHVDKVLLPEIREQLEQAVSGAAISKP